MAPNRQTVGATIQVFNNVTGGQWMFMKEISSDGDISTVRTTQINDLYSLFYIILSLRLMWYIHHHHYSFMVLVFR